jgi:hypothetical protein
VRVAGQGKPGALTTAEQEELAPKENRRLLMERDTQRTSMARPGILWSQPRVRRGSPAGRKAPPGPARPIPGGL